MDQQKKEIKIELSPEVAQGTYANLAIIAHSASEFVMDMIYLAPNAPQAKVQSRIIMTPENAKQLLYALKDNIDKYEQIFGTIQPKTPKTIPGQNGVPPMSWPGSNNQN